MPNFALQALALTTSVMLLHMVAGSLLLVHLQYSACLHMAAVLLLLGLPWALYLQNTAKCSSLIAEQLCRCMMHGFSLLMVSVFGHSFAASVVKACSKLVAVVRKSQNLGKWLTAEIARDPEYRGPRKLHQAATTRFASMWECMNSVLQLHPFLLQLVSRHRKELTTAPQKELVQTVTSSTFPEQLEVLTELALPFDQVHYVSTNCIMQPECFGRT